VVAVAAECLERCDGPAVGGGEVVGLRERLLPGEFLEHLALLRPMQVEGVEEPRDLVVALVDDLHTVEPGIDVVEERDPLLTSRRHRAESKRSRRPRSVRYAA